MKRVLKVIGKKRKEKNSVILSLCRISGRFSLFDPGSKHLVETDLFLLISYICWYSDVVMHGYVDQLSHLTEFPPE